MILLEFAVNLFTKTWFRIRSLTSARQACRKIAVLSLIRSQRQLAGEGLYGLLQFVTCVATTVPGGHKSYRPWNKYVLNDFPKLYSGGNSFLPWNSYVLKNRVYFWGFNNIGVITVVLSVIVGTHSLFLPTRHEPEMSMIQTFLCVIWNRNLNI